MIGHARRNRAAADKDDHPAVASEPGFLKLPFLP
jgi:hypothetical protein